MRDMRKDFDAAGITATDSEARRADFHCLRKTFDTRLQANGVGFVTSMNLMRHSDPRLTAGTYTDASLLPKAEAINGLPWYGERGTEKGTGSRVETGSDVSATVHTALAVKLAETHANIGENADLSLCVFMGTDRQNGGGGGNRTPVRKGIIPASTRVSGL